MGTKFLQRNIFQRVFGIPATPKPQNKECWKYANGQVTIFLDKAPELKKPGGAIRLEGRNLPKRVLVVLDDDNRFHAFHNRCAHVGHRRLDYVPGAGTVQCCSVNKSTYDMTGAKIFGPAPTAINVFPVEARDNTLIITVPS